MASRLATLKNQPIRIAPDTCRIAGRATASFRPRYAAENNRAAMAERTHFTL